jgi:UDP-N-acetylmuramate dehydrogenase
MAQLSDFTSFHVGGPARQVVTVSTEAEIITAVEKADAAGSEILILGSGTNVLISDAGFSGTVIHILNSQVESEVDACSGATLTIGAGENWDAFVQTTISRGFAGLETLSGIPGTVGAAPIQNIGAYGHEVSEFITRVRTYDRKEKKVRTFTNAECNFNYRGSRFKVERNRYVILDVAFQLRIGEMTAPISYLELANALSVEVGEKAPVATTREATLILRASKGMLLDTQDHDSWSAGSFFTNPIVGADVAARLPADAPRWAQSDGRIKVSAAWLMEHAGVHKGDAHSGARISTKHVLALTNTGNATATDIAALAKEARDKVQDSFGIVLEAEVNLIGLTLD